MLPQLSAANVAVAAKCVVFCVIKCTLLTCLGSRLHLVQTNIITALTAFTVHRSATTIITTHYHLHVMHTGLTQLAVGIVKQQHHHKHFHPRQSPLESHEQHDTRSVTSTFEKTWMPMSRRASPTVALILLLGGVVPVAQSGPAQWTHWMVSYGSEERQHLHISNLVGNTSSPAPVYLAAHGNGGVADMRAAELQTIADSGYALISWESFSTVGPTNSAAAVADCALMFQWVQANGTKYGIDPTRVVFGGRSRGSVISWREAHSHPGVVKGIYMYNALPGSVMSDASRAVWDPVADVTNGSPPIYFAYGPRNPPIDGNIHKPANVDPIIQKYTTLGMADKITRTSGMDDDSCANHDGNGDCMDTSIFKYYHVLADALRDDGPWPMPSGDTDADTDTDDVEAGTPTPTPTPTPSSSITTSYSASGTFSENTDPNPTPIAATSSAPASRHSMLTLAIAATCVLARPF